MMAYSCTHTIFSPYFRQKIDEAPTPFRYSSESDHSENECESDGSDSAGLKQKKSHGSKSATDSHIHFNFAGTHGENQVSPPQKSASSVEDSWEAIHAKLNYQKHLQGITTTFKPSNYWLMHSNRLELNFNRLNSFFRAQISLMVTLKVMNIT